MNHESPLALPNFALLRILLQIFDIKIFHCAHTCVFHCITHGGVMVLFRGARSNGMLARLFFSKSHKFLLNETVGAVVRDSVPLRPVFVFLEGVFSSRGRWATVIRAPPCRPLGQRSGSFRPLLFPATGTKTKCLQTHSHSHTQHTTIKQAVKRKSMQVFGVGMQKS